jgi:predicted ATPase
LGIITGIAFPQKEKLDLLLNRLNVIFSENGTTKAKVVNILKEYLPNFEHEEKNKFLDGKM